LARADFLDCYENHGQRKLIGFPMAHTHDHENHDELGHHGGHGHTHGTVDPGLFTSIANSDAGIRAVKWSLILLGVTAVAQLAIVFLSGSVSLLSDTVHNFADASSAIPL
jgi:Co/Zn/Cd efflux system component